MGETGPFRRTWRVTVLRGLVALVPAVALAALIASGQPEASRPGQFGASFFGFVIVPAVWLLLGGAWVEHRLSKRGPAVVWALHLAGSWCALWVVVLVGSAIDSASGREPMESLGAFFWSIVIPPWVTVGFLAAWLVPGSFPSRRAAAPVASAL